jgi:hypothetical protein
MGGAAVANGGSIAIGGQVQLQVIRSGAWMTDELRESLRSYRPGSDLGRIVKQILVSGLTPGAAEELFETLSRSVVYESSLSLKVIRHPESPLLDPRYALTGDPRYLIEDLGVVSRKVVTTAGVNYLATQLKNQAAAILNYHSLGTGTTAEATGDTALVTEWAGADYTGGVRATGTQTNPSANVMRSVGTNTKSSAGTSAVTEHGLNTSATQGSVTLWDRSVFSAVNLAQNDSLQATYDGTFAAGG